jgi:hypothetical protein
MKKTEFIDYIKKLPCCKGLVNAPKLVHTNDAGDNIYSVNVRLIKGKVIEYRDVHYVVIGEGTEKEEVYFMDKEPADENIAIERI